MPSYTSSKPRGTYNPHLEHLEPSPKITNLKILRSFVQHAATVPAFQHQSNMLLATFTSSHRLPILHIQPEENPDHLLRLHLLIHATKSLRQYLARERKISAAGAIIVVDSLSRDFKGFKQACWVVDQHTTDRGLDVLNGRGVAFGRFTIIRGACGNSDYGGASSSIINAIKTMSKVSSNKDFVWHECGRPFVLTNFLDVLA
jgi:hypothetical protein